MLQWQTVDLPNGMNFNVWGPCSMKRNDLYCLGVSGLDEHIYSIQDHNDGLYYKVYGDSAYCVSGYSSIIARHDIEYIENVELKARCRLENKVISSCRQAIE